MANGTVTNAWHDTTKAYLAVMVTEQEPTASGLVNMNVEYIASTPLLDVQGNAKTVAQLKAELVAGITALRAQRFIPPTAVAISGSVSV